MTAIHPPLSRTRLISPLVGAIAFLAFYLTVDVVSGLVSDSPRPMPGASVGEVYTYLTTNGAASTVTGALQLLSVTGLTVFVGATVRRVAGTVNAPARRVASVAGWLAVAAMTVSATIAIVLGLTASSMAPDMALSLRMVSFYAGGVTHVVALGVFLLALSRLTGWTRSVRVTEWIAAVPAVLSITSLLWMPFSILLPVGRLMVMVALITAGVSLARGRTRVVDPRA